MKKILVVGKDPKVFEDLRDYFDPQEYKLLSSYDPKNPIISTINLKPDLVILDLSCGSRFGNLPDLKTQNSCYSEIEVLKKLKECNSNLPIIAITDDSYDQTTFRLIKEKVFGIIKSPIQPERISFMVKEALFPGLSRMVHAPASIGKEQKDLNEVTKFSNPSQNPEKVKIDCEKIHEGYSADKEGYIQIFDRLLAPIYDEIVVNSKGSIYDNLISGLEKSLLSLTLKYCNHNQVKASQILGISRNTLRERIKRYDLW